MFFIYKIRMGYKMENQKEETAESLQGIKEKHRFLAVFLGNIRKNGKI